MRYENKTEEKEEEEEEKSLSNSAAPDPSARFHLRFQLIGSDPRFFYERTEKVWTPVACLDFFWNVVAYHRPRLNKNEEVKVRGG